MSEASEPQEEKEPAPPAPPRGAECAGPAESGPAAGGGEYCLTPEEEADGELFVRELSAGAGSAGAGSAGEPPQGDCAYPTGPPPEEIFRWYRRLAYPKATQLVFQDPDLYGALCEFCRAMANVVTDAGGRVVQVFCLSCCAVISGHGPNRCAGGTRSCVGTRFVDAVGAVSCLCSGCHQLREEHRRRGRGARPCARPAPGKARALAKGSQ